ncbi:MAG TPA: hypothetical protein VMB48_09865, partial [Steroidobacteraceae bacterium]|nr:hypothetical protein [Steroidobacteraceae bacterium]
PTEAAPTEAAPTEAAPTEAAPTEAAPTEAAPTEAAPTEAAPTAAASTAAAPAAAAPNAAPAPAVGASAATTAAASPAAPTRVGAVHVSLSDQARDQVASDPRFQQDELRAAIEQSLRSRGLLAAGNPATLEVSVEDYGVHLAANTVIFGYTLSNAVLSARLWVQGPAGNGPDLSVLARVRLHTRAGQEHVLNPLYRRLGTLAADDLAGTHTPQPQDLAIPR